MPEPLQPEDRRGLLMVANMAADIWAVAAMDTPMTQAERTRGVVETAVMHLIEQGLLVVPDDISDRLQKPVSVKRDGDPHA